MLFFFYRSLNSDYKGSGFDRGHMAAAGNHRLAQKHVEQTFYLTNMAPQVIFYTGKYLRKRDVKYSSLPFQICNTVYFVIFDAKLNLDLIMIKTLCEHCFELDLATRDCNILSQSFMIDTMLLH